MTETISDREILAVCLYLLFVNGLRLHDQQGIHNARRNPIEAGKNQTIKIADSEPLRRFSSRHIELAVNRQDLRIVRDVSALQLGWQGPNAVEMPRYAEAERSVYINATQNFAPVPPDVWNFHMAIRSSTNTSI